MTLSGHPEVYVNGREDLRLHLLVKSKKSKVKSYLI
jgi:hypothetical protein